MRKYFQFRLRSFLVLVAVIGLALAWFRRETPQRIVSWSGLWVEIGVRKPLHGLVDADDRMIRDAMRWGVDSWWNGPYELQDLAGHVLVRGQWRRGRREGLWTVYHPSGAPAAAGQCHHDAPIGRWTFWDEQGRITEIGSLALYLLRPEEQPPLWMGPSHWAAKRSTRSPRSDQAVEGIYTKGLAGFYHTYRADGSLEAAGPMENGEPHGLWKEYDSANRIVAQGKMRYGRRQGLWHVKDGDSGPFRRQFYSLGERVPPPDVYLRQLAHALRSPRTSAQAELHLAVSEEPEAAAILFDALLETGDEHRSFVPRQNKEVRRLYYERLRQTRSPTDGFRDVEFLDPWEEQELEICLSSGLHLWRCSWFEEFEEVVLSYSPETRRRVLENLLATPLEITTTPGPSGRFLKRLRSSLDEEAQP